MAFFLFIDESGHDRGESPYEVLAGIAVEDRDLWNLIDDIKRIEREAFGLAYSREKDEIKGKKILKRKVFRHASQLPAIDPDRRRQLAREFLLDGTAVTREKVTALAQAKLWFVREVLNLCVKFHCHAFASIVTQDAPRPVASVLRPENRERPSTRTAGYPTGILRAQRFDDDDPSRRSDRVHYLVGISNSG